MGLIYKPKSGSLAKQASDDEQPQLPTAAADAWQHSVHFCEEAANDLAREEKFQKTLEAALRPTREEHARVERSQERRASLWLRKMKPGEKLDWDEVIACVAERDRRSASFLAKIVAHAREQGLLDD